MNFSLICRYLSILTAGFGMLFIGCLGISLYYGEAQELQIQWVALLLLALATGIVLYLFSYKEKIHKLLRKEALCIVGTSWGIISIMAALPYLVILPNCAPWDAIFESVSGLTTTGSTVFSNVEAFPKSLIFWRSLTNWVGGSGIVTVLVALFAFVGASGKFLYARESSAKTSDMDTSRIQQGAWKILNFYLLLSAACALAYHLCGISWFDSICHMFSTVATAGFSTKNLNFMSFQNPAFEWTAIVFMTISGANFILLIKVLYGGSFKELIKNTEFKSYIAILFWSSIITALFILLQNPNKPYLQSIRDATFQVVSLLTTTGFVSANFQVWAPIVHILFLFLMFIGGCTASTAGGLKVIRAVIVGKLSLANLEKTFQIGVVRPIVINGRTLDNTTEREVMGFFILYVLIAALGILIVGLMEYQLSCQGVVSSVLSCLSNVGPGFNEVFNDFSCLRGCTKVFLALLMVMGRLELYALLVFLVPSFWRNFK